MKRYLLFTLIFIFLVFSGCQLVTQQPTYTFDTSPALNATATATTTEPSGTTQPTEAVTEEHKHINDIADQLEDASVMSDSRVTIQHKGVGSVILTAVSHKNSINTISLFLTDDSDRVRYELYSNFAKYYSEVEDVITARVIDANLDGFEDIVILMIVRDKAGVKRVVNAAYYFKDGYFTNLENLDSIINDKVFTRYNSEITQQEIDSLMDTFIEKLHHRRVELDYL